MPPDPTKTGAIEQDIPWAELEKIVHRDPAGRGLASFRTHGASLDAGQLRAAAVHLAQHATSVGIVTGFCIADGSRVAAETDGPPGALFLARAFAALGVDTILISDRFALPLLEVGCDVLESDRRSACRVSARGRRARSAGPRAQPHRRERRNRAVARCVFLHRPRSVAESFDCDRAPQPQPHARFAGRASSARAPRPVERFAAIVPADDRDICHNMRGQSINAYTAKTHRLFERIAAERLPITTIGIGDGGNEIGMGSFAWETIVDAVGGDAASPAGSRPALPPTLRSSAGSAIGRPMPWRCRWRGCEEQETWLATGTASASAI